MVVWRGKGEGGGGYLSRFLGSCPDLEGGDAILGFAFDLGDLVVVEPQNRDGEGLAEFVPLLRHSALDCQGAHALGGGREGARLDGRHGAPLDGTWVVERRGGKERGVRGKRLKMKICGICESICD